RKRKKVVLIGKGLEVDSGGLDLKPPDGMLRMKYDMAGAAAVLGIMRALPTLKPAIEVHGLIAATENMPSGSAIRPGDVLRAMNGTTIEIGNTGACVIALGQLCSGLLANNQPLANRIMKAADAAGERLWQLPLIDEYRENLKSEVADLNNVGPRGGGAITAGLFLKEFAGKTPWA